MKNEKKTEKPYKTKLDKYIGEIIQKAYNKLGVVGSILVGLVLLIISIIFFIWLVSNNYFSWFNFDLSDKNEVGDALGGLTAPFIGITGVILTFLAFWVQYKFNQKQFKFYMNDKIDRKVDEYNKILDSILNYDNFRDTNIPTTLLGSGQILLDTYKGKESKVVGENFMTVIFSNYLEFCSIYHNYNIDYGVSKKDIMMNDKSKEHFEIFINVCLKFESFLKTFINELSYINTDEKEINNLLFLYLKKFELLYHNFEKTHLLIILLYYGKFNENKVEQKIISQLLVRYAEPEKNFLIISRVVQKLHNMTKPY